MPIFSSPDVFQEHKQYIPLLKKALLGVKPKVQKKFLYLKQYPFGPKKLPLVLVDYDANCQAALAKAGLKPTDEGLVSLTPQDELNFEPKKGNLKRISLKKYFAAMGTGIKPVYVPTGETDDDESAPETGKVDENETKRRELLARIAELQGKTFPAKIEGLKSQILEKAKSLGTANKFAEATGLLDQLAAKLGTGDTATTTKTPSDDGFAQKWAAAKQSWEAANTSTNDQIAKLQKTLRESKDEDFLEIAEFGLNAVTGNFRARLTAIMMEMNPTNAETRAATARKGQAIVSAFQKYLAADADGRLKACDENPFKVPVTIRSSLKAALDDLAKALATA